MEVGIDCTYKKQGNKLNYVASYARVDKSDLQVYPYFGLMAS